jgi:branched-subunit amino acid aminotransferase/4-amino-4-deoxychorismate lyase
VDGRIVGGGGPAGRALRYGDGLFATLRVSAGRLLDADRHARRLLAGAELLDLDPPPDWEDAATVVARLLSAAHALGARPGGEAIIRCQWSAAPDARGYGRARAASALVELFPAPAARSLRVAVLDDDEVPPPVLPRVKSCSALPHVLAARAAARRSAPEAIRVIGGHLTEAVSANLFWLEGGRLRTPEPGLPLYPGIVRERAIEAAAVLGIPLEEGRWGPSALRRAEAAVLTSSVRGMERVEELGGLPLGDPPGIRALASETARARGEEAPVLPDRDPEEVT